MSYSITVTAKVIDKIRYSAASYWAQYEVMFDNGAVQRFAKKELLDFA